MPQAKIDIIRQSFSRLSQDACLVGDLFHERLAETAPDVVSAFGDYFDSRENKFRVISEVVNLHLRSVLSLPVTPGGQMGPIPSAVRQLGQRRAKYDITDAQFAQMKEALLWTLEKVLAGDFAPETRDAWSQAYDNLAGMIQQAMTEPEAAETLVFSRATDIPCEGGLEESIVRFFWPGFRRVV